VLTQLDSAQRKADLAAIDAAADAVALKLARLHLLGSVSAAERTGWRIVDTDAAIDPAPLLARAVANGQVAGFFAGLRPAHPDYAGLRAAFAVERDPTRRKAIALNMERWRWLPRDLGPDYILVNAASFEARLWRGGQPIGTWRVIVGKPSTATPVFNATVAGVTLNPWWDVPASIVRESVGALVRRHPAAARARGYVWNGGRIRQKPGASNSLGEMKLAMANPWNVYLHDTPNRKLFDEQVRAFSHGCVRVSDALGLAQVLLEGVRTREQIDAQVATRQTETVPLPRPVPIYIAYFTAGLRGDGTFAYFPDVYRRDAGVSLAPQVNDACGV
jgi:murein L,D-transpeptidase YcbB/YkuD